MGFKLKNAFSWKGLAGLILSPVTGGASLALTAKSAMDKQKQQEKQKQEKKAAAEMAYEERQGEISTEQRRKKKMQELEEKNRQATGIASLMGQDNELG